MTTRTEKFLRLQNMRAHYHNMLKVEPTIAFKEEPKKKKSQRYEHTLTKAQKNWQYERLLNNTLIFQRLRNIGTGKTSRNISHIQSLEVRRKDSLTLQTERKTIVSSRSRQPQIDRENAILVNRIRTVCPSVGSKQEWRNHYKHYKAQCRKLSRSKDISETRESRQLKEDLSGLVQRLRPELMKRVGTSKSGSTKRGSYDLDRNRYDEKEDSCPIHSVQRGSQAQNLTVLEQPGDNNNDFALVVPVIDSDTEEECIKQLKRNQIYDDD